MKKERIATYVSLIASVLLLLSVVVPHHHHADGMPCYHWLTEIADDESDDSSGTSHSAAEHDCGCLGHNQALFSSVEQHAASDLHLIPLFILFHYINPLSAVALPLPFERERAFYIESLHDSWIAKASGRRAPPFGVKN